MELSGKIFKVLPLVKGESQRGQWQKQELVLEIDNGKFPKKVMVSVWGDLVSGNSFEEGKDISVEFDVESREYNGRWYTDVKVWRINKIDGGAAAAKPSNYNKPAYNNAAPPAHTVADVPTAQIDDDLPF